MSKITRPLCYWCKHFEYGNGFKCKAFENTNYSIPFEIWNSDFDHRGSHPDDNGITFEKLDVESLLHQDHFSKLTEEQIERYFEERITYLDLTASADAPNLNYSEDDDIYY